MARLLVIGIGGFLGSVLRFTLSGWVHRVVGNPWFPYGTLAVNVAGCLLIGFLGGYADNRELLGAETRLFLFIGVLGSFTTFSTFGYETVALLRDAQTGAALANIALHLVLGLGAVVVGYGLSRLA